MLLDRYLMRNVLGATALVMSVLMTLASLFLFMLLWGVSGFYLGVPEPFSNRVDARSKPDDFRGHQARENMIKAALLPLLKNDVDEVERIFLIIKAQREY